MRIAEPATPALYFLMSILKRLVLLPRSFRLMCLVIPENGWDGRVVYLGEGESLSYVRKIFHGEGGEIAARRIPLWRIGKAIREMVRPGTILCVEVNRLLGPCVPGKHLPSFPWVRQRVVLSSPEYEKRKKTINSVYGRKVRKYGYEFRMLTDAVSLKQFYSELYLPHISARFGEERSARGLAELEKAVKSGFLLQVLHNDVWVSGAVCRVRGKEISVLTFGHLPEEIFPLGLGALSAAYYHLFSYAESHGLESVDLGRSRPRTADGVYWHKRRWGAIPENDLWPHTAIRIFVPEGCDSPEPLEKLLVWNGRTFEELGALRNQEVVSCVKSRET
jgi:hypothetical protein